MTPRVDFDAVLIGTGPPMLFEGLALAEAGQRVVFVDRGSEIGGSWHTPAVLGHSNVEVGVHLIENRPHLNAVIENLLGPSNVTLSPPDFGLIFGRRVPLTHARTLLYALVGGKALINGAGERATRAIRNSVAALVYSRVPLAYPTDGFVAVLNALRERLLAANAEFRFKTVVHCVAVTKENVVAHTDAQRLSAARLVMSSRAHAPIEGLEAMWENATREVVNTLVMKLAGAEPRFESYVEIFGDGLLRRVRNVSRITVPPPPPGTAIISVQLRRRPQELSDTALATEVVARMRRLSLVPANVEILAVELDQIPLTTLSRKTTVRIARLFPQSVTVLQTVDLSDRVHPLRVRGREPRSLVPASAATHEISA
jgi:hypothetical protein